MRIHWKTQWLAVASGTTAIAASLFADVQVAINPAVHHQTILGWGATASDIDIPAPLRGRILDEAVNDLGLTRLRLEPPGGNKASVRRWEWLNDNGDPDDINWSALNTAALDERIIEWVAPFKQRVEANGEPFNLYVSPSFFDGGSSGSPPAWLLNSPGEYAEFAVSLATHLRDTHGITPDFHAILNEAGNNNPFTAAVVGRMIRTLGPKLQSLGLPTKIQFPECVNSATSWNYIQALQNDAAIWPHVGLLSYHLYGGQGSRTNIRDFGLARGIPTAQTEYMGTTVNDLYNDLTLGGVSYWEHYVLAYFGANPSGDYFGVHFNLTSFTRYNQYWLFRQFMHYVRPGALRVQATSDDSALRPLAFVHNGRATLVALNNTAPLQARTMQIAGLPAGTYAACQSVGTSAYQELGLRTVSDGVPLEVNIPANAVLTIYPHSGTNQPPTVTDWRATPNYLTLPSSSITLSAAATDPETDPISYAWTITSQPGGAAANLTTPSAASTAATGLTVAGEYVFDVAASDAAHTVHREVRLKVFADNQPPQIEDLHNRIPVQVTLPANTTQLRTGGRDLEGDPLSFQWSIVSQPPGANVQLGNPTSNQCPVTFPNVPGDYVFRVAVSDPTHTVTRDLTVPVYPVNDAPVISSATATPATVVQPAAVTTLSASTSDPNNDVISHWWEVASAPAGASPAVARPGSPNTAVSGLTHKGEYTFTLTVVDRTKVTTRNVVVRVTSQAGDLDLDRDVDQSDYGLLQNCLAGDATAYAVGCADADLDFDGDVDGSDVNVFQLCRGGSNLPPGC